jgi:hypothetical protein
LHDGGNVSSSISEACATGVRRRSIRCPAGRYDHSMLFDIAAFGLTLLLLILMG